MALRAVPDHPKFSRLKAILQQPKGCVVGWLETVWHFTGRFTPHGNIGKYSDLEIEAWVEWDGEAGALVAALVESGWLDRSTEFRLLTHDWDRHADNATKLAVKRSGKPFCLHTVETPLQQCGDSVEEIATPLGLPGAGAGAGAGAEEQQPLSPSAPSVSSSRKPEVFLDSWNANCGRLPKVLKLSAERRRKILARTKEGLMLEQFVSAIEVADRTPFLRGENDKRWSCDFDWLMGNGTNLLKVIEGSYGKADLVRASADHEDDSLAQIRRRTAEAREVVRRENDTAQGAANVGAQ